MLKNVSLMGNHTLLGLLLHGLSLDVLHLTFEQADPLHWPKVKGHFMFLAAASSGISSAVGSNFSDK